MYYNGNYICFSLLIKGELMKVKVDPITRIEGHLKVEVDIEDGIVKSAKCSGGMYRGIEKALKGYDYMTAVHITQRTCGCCPYAHAEASALAIENAVGIELNKNAKLLRNMVIGAYKIKDYILHFYTLSLLDFMDVKAILDYNGDDYNMLELKKWVLKELASNKIFPMPLFLQRYKANYITLRKLNITLIEHYLESFEMMKKASEMVKIFGSKAPHMVSIEAGGVTTLPTAEKLARYLDLAMEVKHFINDGYLKDVIKVAKYYKDYFKIGKGPNDFLTFNTILNLDGSYMFPGGFSKNYRLVETKINPYNIVEDGGYAYYKQSGSYRPLELEELTPISLEEFNSNTKKYSWIKAPRFEGSIVEVGPAAVVINTYLSGKNKKLNKLVDSINNELGISIRDYNSVMGRHLSRAIISKLLIEKLIEDALNVDEGVLGFTQIPPIPSNVKGVGLTEATRGALAHFTEIGENGFIKNYEMIVPTTWNISPRDNKNRPGALEQMLMGTKVKDEKNPIEIARIVRSIDPCLACAVH
jgi:Ni,Fe-hydrogenase I large subunit